RELADLHLRVDRDRQVRDVRELERHVAVPARVDEPGGRVDQEAEPSERALAVQPPDDVLGQPDALERRAEHELTWVEDERLAVDLDELGQVLLGLLDVDERVEVVAKDPEIAVDAHVDARRLQERRVVGLDLDPAFLQQAGDRAVGENHGWRVSHAATLRGMAATRTIQLRTQIPGPRSLEILERLHGAVASPLAVMFPIVAESARGASLTDVDGNTFIDFAGGVGCLNVGHSHPDVVAAAQEQLERFSHTDFTIVPYETYVRLAERLGELAPISGPVKAAFFNAGTEAVENAVKFARLATKRQAVIAFEGAFHGRTYMSLSLTSKTRPYKAGLGPFVPDVYRVPYPNALRGISTADALDALERALVVQVAPETVAAIVVELVQGEGGFVVAPPEFVAGVRKVCDRHGILLVIDEVQTGFARTGRFFAAEHYGV